MKINLCNYIIDKQLKHDLNAMKITTKLDEHINTILRKKERHGDLPNCLHGACFSSVNSTFLTAVENNYFVTWPGLTPKLLQKH